MADTLSTTIARNLAFLRRREGMTQMQLAQMLNYSDKTISKWERGDGLPDIAVLLTLSDHFSVTVDAICREDLSHAPAALTQTEDAPAQGAENRVSSPECDQPRDPLLGHKRRLTLLLSCGLCWLCATIAFVALRLLGISGKFPSLVFIYALPASAVVCVVLTALWWNLLWQLCAVSGLIWSCALSISLSFTHPQMRLLYLIAAALQVLACLWYLLRYERARSRGKEAKSSV